MTAARMRAAALSRNKTSFGCLPKKYRKHSVTDVTDFIMLSIIIYYMFIISLLIILLY